MNRSLDLEIKYQIWIRLHQHSLCPSSCSNIEKQLSFTTQIEINPYFLTHLRHFHPYYVTFDAQINNYEYRKTHYKRVIKMEKRF